MASLTVFHLILFLLFRRLARRQKVGNWGVVYDAKTRKPLGKSIARIFSPEYDRMLEAYVTDKYGRYGFLAGNNIYYITAEKDGYESYKTENIDLSKGETKVVGRDMPLRRLDMLTPQSAQKDEVNPVNGGKDLNGLEEKDETKESIWG